MSSSPHMPKSPPELVERFGMEAMTFVNSPEGRQLCLRGINAKVVEPGIIRVGDTISKA